jgi:hypothetical protein
MATRSLWFAMGLHTAWNFLQGTIFGVAVSGSGAPADSLFRPLIQGNPWLTGGAFGIEASVITVVVGLGVGISFLVHAVRQQRMMRGLVWRGGINVLHAVPLTVGARRLAQLADSAEITPAMLSADVHDRLVARDETQDLETIHGL